MHLVASEQGQLSVLSVLLGTTPLVKVTIQSQPSMLLELATYLSAFTLVSYILI